MLSFSSDYYCCNLSGGVALIVWFTTNGMCEKNKNICMWREQAIIEWSRWSDRGEWPLIMLVNQVNSWLSLLTVISIVACCHGAKLCTHAARDFRSQHYKVIIGFSSNVNIVEWLVSMTAVRLFVGSALTISFGLGRRGYTFDRVLLTFFLYFFKTLRVCV